MSPKTLSESVLDLRGLDGCAAAGLGRGAPGAAPPETLSR